MLHCFPLRVASSLEAINSLIVSFKSSLCGKEETYLVNASLLQYYFFLHMLPHMQICAERPLRL